MDIEESHIIEALAEEIKSINKKIKIGLFPECNSSGKIDLFIIDNRYKDVNTQEIAITHYVHSIQIDLKNNTISSFNKSSDKKVSYDLHDENGYDKIMKIISEKVQQASFRIEGVLGD